MKVSIVTIAYSRPEEVQRLCASADSQAHQVCLHLFLHTSNEATARACEALAQQPGVVYYPYGVNRGVSRSWNEGILTAYGQGADVVIVANDDVVFGSGDLDRLAGRAAACRHSYIVTCAGYHELYRRRLPSHGYACFAINPVALERIGCFDENFFPAYCEDQDFAYRAGLAGLAEENCPDTDVRHVGSAAIFLDTASRTQNAITHGRNLSYYRRKWGGDGGQEVFTHPFGDPRLMHFISPDSRHHAYGPLYDRPDADDARP